MPDEAEDAAAPGNSPPLTRFIANASLPQKFDTKGNLAANWKKWIQIWKAYEIVTGLDKQPSTLRVAMFITCIGHVYWKYTLDCRSRRMMTGKTSTKCSNCGRITA